MKQYMEFSQDEWLRLIEAIEADGGFQAEDDLGMPKVCTTRTYQFTGPKKLPMKLRVLEGCDNESMFEILYDPGAPVHLELEARDRKGNLTGEKVVIDHSGEAGLKGAVDTVTVCAVDDGVGWWPRYAHVMDEEDE